MSSWASTRPPKSERLASMPESTKAIEGAESGPFECAFCRLARAGQSWSAPTAAGQSSPEVNAAGVCGFFGFLGFEPGFASSTTGWSGVITSPGFVAASCGRSPATTSPAAASTIPSLELVVPNLLSAL